MIDVNTIVGDAVESKDGAVIIPISKVSFGFVAGGGDISKKDKMNEKKAEEDGAMFAGGTGAGMSINPIAFLVVTSEQIRLMSVYQNNTVERIIDILPSIIDDIKNAIQKR